jgi:hypothetical protein
LRNLADAGKGRRPEKESLKLKRSFKANVSVKLATLQCKLQESEAR